MVILDVREKDEFTTEHIPGSILCPMSEVPVLAPGILNNIQADDVVVMCRSGRRAGLVLKDLQGLAKPGCRVSVYDGGILKWKSEGKPVVTQGRGRLPIMRQVQAIAGGLVLLGVLGSIFVNPALIWISAFVGAGLMVAGLTGFCGMAILLQKMPWNCNQEGGSCER